MATVIVLAVWLAVVVGSLAAFIDHATARRAWWAGVFLVSFSVWTVTPVAAVLR